MCLCNSISLFTVEETSTEGEGSGLNKDEDDFFITKHKKAFDESAFQ